MNTFPWTVSFRLHAGQRRSQQRLHTWRVVTSYSQTLLNHDLVDAFWLMIYPIILGRGKRLFAVGAIPVAFNVSESVVSSTGVIVVNYERAGAVTTVGAQGSATVLREVNY